MTRHQLARLRAALEDIIGDRHRQRGLDAIEDLISEARAEHEAEDRAWDSVPINMET